MEGFQISATEGTCGGRLLKMEIEVGGCSLYVGGYCWSADSGIPGRG